MVQASKKATKKKLPEDSSVTLQLRLTDSGRPFLYPSFGSRTKRISGDLAEFYADLQRITEQDETNRELIEEAVHALHSAGFPWSVIGFAVGMSSDAARKRFKDLVAPVTDATTDTGEPLEGE